VSDARSSTATATTATADPAGASAGRAYRGRFAPSPTGLLHQGSLVAALASWLEARRHHGRWLLRIEDLDTPRVVPGAAAELMRTLEALGLTWDEPVLWQSRRLEAYAEALDTLRRAGRVYACDCPRRELAGAYPGTCRDRTDVPAPHALRFALAPEEPLDFEDRWQGPRRGAAGTVGDPVIRRRDGLFAYQLAVVVDDAFQGVTDVVRGTDLLDSTPWQLALQAALGLQRPGYAHCPVLVEADGAKLAKSRRSVAVDSAAAGASLHRALQLLGQAPPGTLATAAAPEVLAWAVEHWRPEPLRGRADIALQQPDLGSGTRLY
jgi:glutamyl-Q tRNA(Asp) synthetase